jgi:hypothetical protein
MPKLQWVPLECNPDVFNEVLAGAFRSVQSLKRLDSGRPVWVSNHPKARSATYMVWILSFCTSNYSKLLSQSAKYDMPARPFPVPSTLSLCSSPQTRPGKSIPRTEMPPSRATGRNMACFGSSRPSVMRVVRRVQHPGNVSAQASSSGTMAAIHASTNTPLHFGTRCVGQEVWYR